ncbi:hypothetical protein GQ457_05G016800 [Hibiscus cannabinus]
MVIIEVNNLKVLKLDELIRSLLTHELMSKPLKREKEKIKDQGEIEDEDMTYLFKKFTRFMKSEMEKSKHESKKKKKKMKDPQKNQNCKETRHTKYDCPCFKKKGSSSNKA